jgi:hypothetical protein
VFGKLADGRSLLQGETDEPVSELFEHPVKGRASEVHQHQV